MLGLGEAPHYLKQVVLISSLEYIRQKQFVLNIVVNYLSRNNSPTVLKNIRSSAVVIGRCRSVETLLQSC